MATDFINKDHSLFIEE